MDSCNICIEEFKKTNAKIQCAKCEFYSCVKCTQRYLLETHDDPHCMNCKTKWNLVFLYNNFPKVFVNKNLKNHRENLFFEREKSVLPNTMEYVDDYKESQHLLEVLRETRKRENELKIELKTLKNTKYNLERQYHNAEMRITNGTGIKHNSNNFVYKFNCPQQNCHSFLNQEFVCTTCNVNVCNMCHEVKKEGSEHVCDKNTVKNISSMMKESKPCPNCGVFIHKIVGCSQMWCTQCHTAFDYNTGRMVNSNIHNPHYYEFLRNNKNGLQRNPLDIPCGGLPDYYHISRVYEPYRRSVQIERIIIKKHMKKIEIYHRSINHIIHIDLPAKQNKTHITFFSNLVPRIKFLMNQMSETELKKILYKKQKDTQKQQEYLDIITMVTHTMSDLFGRYIQDMKIANDTEVSANMFCKVTEPYIEEMNALKDYANNEFKKISELMNCVKPMFNENFRLV